MDFSIEFPKLPSGFLFQPGAQEAEMTSMIVVGGAGKLGRAVVAAATAAGVEVTAHVRDRSKAADFPSSVRIVEGNGLDPASLSKAIQGHDVVVVTAGGRKEPVSAGIVKNVILAMRESGVKRLIGVSAYGAADPVGFYGWMLNTLTAKLAADKRDMEAAMRQSGLEYTIVRPPILDDGPATSHVQAIPGVTLKGLPAISRADVANFIVEEAKRPRFKNATPVVFKRGTRTAPAK